MPLLAWLAVPGKTALFLFGDNTLRLMVYTLPLLLAGLVAVLLHWRRGSTQEAHR